MIDALGAFTSKAIHFALGVFQGCTLSPVFFNIVLQLGLNTLEQKKSLMYTFPNDSNTSLLTSASADDLQLVTSFEFRDQNQRLLDIFASFLFGTRTMAARTNICCSVELIEKDRRQLSPVQSWPRYLWRRAQS